MIHLLAMAACTLGIRLAGLLIAGHLSKAAKARQALGNASLGLMVVYLAMQIHGAHDLMMAAAVTVAMALLAGGIQLPLLAGIIVVAALRNLP